MTDKQIIEDLKTELIECFDSGESFLHLGMSLKRLARFQLAIFFEIDWNTISLVPLNFFPSATRKVLKLQNLSIPFDSSIIDIFSQSWIPFKKAGERSGLIGREIDELPEPFVLFPLKVKQRVLCAIGLSGLKYKKEKDLDDLSELFRQLSPVLEKNMVIDKSMRRNQRLETIIGQGPTTYFIVNRTGHINEFLPCNKNFLGYTPERVVREPLSLLFPMGKPILKAIWKQVRSNNSRVWGLVNLANGSKNLASLTVEKVLLKYTLQKEYYLVGIEPLESELLGSISSDKTSLATQKDGCSVIRVHICTENFRCIRRCGKMAEYSGEGTFIVHNATFKDERCALENNCLTEYLSVGNHPRTEVAIE